MIADASAWVEYLRDTGSPTHLALRSRVQSGEAIATPAPALLELLAGCGTEREASAVARLLARFEILGTGGLADFEDAALIHRTLRRRGPTIRSVLDCMVAAASLRMGRPLLARGRDYDTIARHFELDLVRL